jgi:hypothetical protein
MINKNIIIGLSFVLFSFLSCRGEFHPQTPTDNMNNQLLLKQPIYDSIQTFVDFNKLANTNFDAQYYLLEFYAYRTDTLDFILTTIHKKTLDNYYLHCPFFYNKDSSILIINNGSNALFDNDVTHSLTEITIAGNKNNEPVIYNPFLWKLTIVNHNQIIIDRLFGAKEVKKNVIILK